MATDDSKQSNTQYIPLAGGKSAADAQLFLNEAEYFIHTRDLDGTTRIMTVLDDFSVGKGADFADDSGSPQTFIFAESLTVSGPFVAQNVTVSANHILSQTGASLDVSGPKLAPYPQSASAGDGAPGAPGNPGGTITLYTEVLPDANGKLALPLLVARGGPGQDGQNAIDGTGGAGGTGGSGGTIAGYVQSPYLAAIDSLNEALGQLDGLAKINAMANTLGSFSATITLSDGTTLGDAITSLVKLGNQLFPDKNNPGNPAPGSERIIVEIADLVTVVIKSFQTLSDSLETALLPSLRVSAGEPGQGGSGRTGNGKANANGPVPTAGSAALALYGDTSQLNPNASVSDRVEFISTTVNLTQCQMLLQKAKMRYLQADAVANPDALKDTATLFQRIINRLAFVPAWLDANGKMPDPMLEPYHAIYTEASSYFSNFSKGLDYYGHGINEVPLVDLNKYNSALRQLLGWFKTIEDAYATYFAALQTQMETRDQLTAATSSANAAISQAALDIEQLKARLDNVGSTILSFAAPIAQKKQDLETIIQNVVTDINDYYNFSFANGFSLFKDLVGALSSIAFMPESGFMSGVQGVSVVGDLINSLYVQPTTTITNDSGVTVNKNYLVNQVKAVKDTVDGLSEAYQVLDNGQLQPDDPGAAKLLMAESQLEKILGDFKSELPDDIQAVQKGFQDYIGIIVARNNAVLEYNAIINVIGTVLSQQQDAQTALDQLQSSSFDTLDPGLPSFVTMLSRLYHQSRDQLMNTYYLASRALQMWSLSNTNFLAQALATNTGGVQPNALTYSFLSIGLENGLLSGLKSFGTNPSDFPHDVSEDGAIIAFTDDATLTTFRTAHGVILRVPLIQRGATGSSSNRLDPAWQNQLLFDQANVRLLLVRVWLDGAKIMRDGAEIDDVIHLRVTHGGYSLFASPSNDVFRFTHESVVKTFQYYTLTPDPQAPQRHKTFMAANFGDIMKNDPTRGENFALLSPFTDWTIELVNTIDEPTSLALLDALKQGVVKKGVIIRYGDQSQTVSGVDTNDDGTVVVTVSLYGVTIQTFTVKGNTITDKSGAVVPEPIINLPAESTTYLDLTGLTAIRLEFTGKSYTFT